MLALVYDGEVAVRRDYPDPTVEQGEVLVQVAAAGICRTDLEILKGYMDFRGVMGHEFVGKVVEGPRRWKGKRVVAEINCICGRCDMCRSGLSNHCRNRTVIGIDRRDGAFAQYVAVPSRNLHEVPEGLDDVEAVFVEPLAAAFQIVRQVEIARSEAVVVLGDGRLGQLVARVLRGRVGRLTLVGKHPRKLEAAEKQGIQTELLKDFAPRKAADLVVDATGAADGFHLAMSTVRPRGTIVLKSTFAGGGDLDLSPLVIDEVTVVGSRCGPFPEGIRALTAKDESLGGVDVSALVSARFPLEDGVEALRAASDPESLKVVLDVAR
jgi:threonine dehydrogenase-like Zn-dependent dehydrogenase